MNVIEVLLSFIDHRLEVVVRYSKNRLRIAVDRKEVLEGYLIVFDNLTFKLVFAGTTEEY